MNRYEHTDHTPEDVLTEEELEELRYEADQVRFEAWQFTVSELLFLEAVDQGTITVDQAEVLDRMRREVEFYENHLRLLPNWGHYRLDFRAPVDHRYLYPDGDETPAERELRQRLNQRRELRAQVKLLRDEGLTIRKEYPNDETMKVIATDPATGVEIVIVSYGYCTYEETGEVERVEVVEVPDDVAKAYTKVETRPVTRRVCAPLLADDEEL